MAEEAEEDVVDVVQVACTVPGGLILQLTKPIDDGTGHTQMRKYGDKFVVPGPDHSAGPGLRAQLDPDGGSGAVVSELPAGFWAEWLSQNAGNPVVDNGMIAEWKPDREPEDPAPKD